MSEEDRLRNEVKRLRDLIHIHLRENWGLEDLTDDRIPGEVLHDSDRMLYEAAARGMEKS